MAFDISTEMANISKLETYYATEYFENDLTLVDWEANTRNLMAKVWGRKDGVYSGEGHIDDGNYDQHYFKNNTTAAERQTIASDIDENRSSIPGYDASNAAHAAIVNNIVAQIKGM